MHTYIYIHLLLSFSLYIYVYMNCHRLYIPPSGISSLDMIDKKMEACKQAWTMRGTSWTGSWSHVHAVNYLYINIYIYVLCIGALRPPPLPRVWSDFQDGRPCPRGSGRREGVVYACRCIHMLHMDICIQIHLGICMLMHSCKHTSFYKLCTCLHMHAYA